MNLQIKLRTLVRICRLALSEKDADRFESLRQLGDFAVPEYRFKWPQISWWNDESFTRYLDKFGELRGMNSDRRWMLHQLMRLTGSVKGDTVECGAFTGARRRDSLR